MLLLPFLLFQSIFCLKPEVSENLKMVVVLGDIMYGSNHNLDITSVSWDKCLDTCRTTWNCTIVVDYLGDCLSFHIGENYPIELKENGVRVGFKTSFAVCPIENRPLFGYSVLSFIVTDGTDFYRTEISETEPGKLFFNHTIHNCLKDIPDGPLEGEVVLTKRFTYNLTSKFLPGESFFMKGRTGSGECGFTLSFYYSVEKKFPVHIKPINGYSGHYKLDVATWNDTVQVRPPLQIDNPYKNDEEFVLRMNSSETQAFIYFNETYMETYDLLPDYPLTDIDQILINDSGALYYNVTVYFIGWTGDCWWEPYTYVPPEE